MNKLSSFQPFVLSSSLSIVAVTETWLASHILDHELLPSDYTIYRTDRSSLGGGVMLAIHNSIPTKKLSSPPSLEVVTVELQLKIPVTLCLIYNPPPPITQIYSRTLMYFSLLTSKSFSVVILIFQILIGTHYQVPLSLQSSFVISFTNSISPNLSLTLLTFRGTSSTLY